MTAESSPGYFTCYGNDVCAIGIHHKEDGYVASFWIRHCDANVPFETPIWRDLDLSEQPEATLSREHGVEPNDRPKTRDWSEMASKRWNRRKQVLESARDFRARKDSCGNEESEEGSRCDVGVQCDMTSCRELVCEWIRDLASPNCATILCNSLLNFGRLMPFYNDDMMDLCMTVYLTSPKTYKVIRQMLQWPAISTLYRHYSDKIRAVKEKLTTVEGIKAGSEDVRKAVAELVASGEQIDTQFTLAIDAFSFRGFSGSTMNRLTDADVSDCRCCDEQIGDALVTGSETTCYTNAFLMLLIPHDYKIPVKVLHLFASTTGAYTKAVDQRARVILENAKEMKMRIWFRATDGDPGVSGSHNSFYEQHICGKSSVYLNLVKDVWTWLCKDDTSFVPISDPLHVWKNVRARYLTRRIILFKDSPPTDLERVRRILRLGNALDDDSQLGKMRDNYVTQMFTFRNVAKLIREKEYTSAFLFLPFACWLAVTFSDRVDREFRIFLCEVAFQLLSMYLEAMQEIPTDSVTRTATDCNRGDVFSRGHYVRRMLNTLCAFGVTLVFGSNSVRMDSLGTHLVENAIGIARSTSSDHRYERIITTYAHNELRKSLAERLNVVLRVPNRITDGGCKIELDDRMCQAGPLASKPRDWNVPYILHLSRALCSPALAPAMKTDALEFANDLDAIAYLSDRQTHDTSLVANSGILSRLFGFKSETADE